MNKSYIQSSFLYSKVNLIFLQERSLPIQQVINFLKDHPLSRTCLILPTQRISHIINQELIKQDILPYDQVIPVTQLPMEALTHHATHTISKKLELIFLLDILHSFPMAELSELFSISSHPLFYLKICFYIINIRAILAENGISIERLSHFLGEKIWHKICQIEKLYLEKVYCYGFNDRVITQLSQIDYPEWVNPFNRIIIALNPNLPTIFDKIIPGIIHCGIPVEILIYDPSKKGANWFDQYGRPEVMWSKINMDIPEDTIYLSPNTHEMFNTISDRLAKMRNQLPDMIVIDPEMNHLIENSLQKKGLNFYNPAGNSLDKMVVGRLILMIDNFLRNKNLQSFLPLLKHPDIHLWLKSYLNIEINRIILWQTIDEKLQIFTHYDCVEFIQFLKQGEINFQITYWIEQFYQFLISWEQKSDLFLKWIIDIFSINNDSENLVIHESINIVHEVLQHLQVDNNLSYKLTLDEIITLLLSIFKEESYYLKKEKNDLELHGWMEIFGEMQEEIFIIGMNNFLEKNISHPFLTEKIAESLGFPSAQKKRASDYYILKSLFVANRKISLFLAQTDEDGNQIYPSCLLLQEKKEILRDRIIRLFTPIAVISKSWQSSWELNISQINIENLSWPSTLSATDIREYLFCPSRYFFQNILKLQNKKYEVNEIDNKVFGRLLHETVASFSKTLEWSSLINADQISIYLEEIWREKIKNNYGNNLNFILNYQAERGIDRLKNFAMIEAKERNNGWRTIATEISFQKFFPNSIILPLSLVGRIDRIDRRDTTNGTEWRILDYKTAYKVNDYIKDHIKKIKDNIPNYIEKYEIVNQMKNSIWINLQLPIYYLVLEAIRNHEFSLASINIETEAKLKVGYFTMPPHMQGNIIYFDEILDYRESAIVAIQGVIQSISNRIFGPPRSIETLHEIFFHRICSPEEHQNLQTIGRNWFHRLKTVNN